MRWLQNFSLIMKSNIRVLQEKIENPERVVEQLIIDMEEELEKVRDSVADAIADEIQLGRRLESASKEASVWMDRAAQALKAGEDTVSKAALRQRLLVDERVETLEKDYAAQKEQTGKLQRAVADLEDKIRQARQRRTLLLARLTRADAVSRINQAVQQSSNKSAFAQFGRLEKQVDRAEAKVMAYDRLDGVPEEARDLALEFEDLKRRLSGDGPDDDSDGDNVAE